MNRYGFVTDFLVSGPALSPVMDTTVCENQLAYERYLRSAIVDASLPAPIGPIRVGEMSRIGKPWHYHAAGANWFIDYGAFYFTLQKVRLEGAVVLVSDRKKTVPIRLWTYCTVDLWCGGNHVLFQNPSVYKPIQYKDAEITLEKGRNLLYVSLQTLGTRDTRTLWGLQILSGREGIEIDVPDREHAERTIEAERFLARTCLLKDTLVLPAPGGGNTFVLLSTGSMDHADKEGQNRKVSLAGKTKFVIPSWCVNATLVHEGQKRGFTCIFHAIPKSDGAKTQKEALAGYLSQMAGIASLDRGDFGFAMPHILARAALGRPRPDEENLFSESLNQIEARYDCSDFLIVSLIRYIHAYGYPTPALEKRTKEVLCGFRYWMSFKGSDAMCFWSENHSLQFYSCAYLAGRLYPAAYFSRAEMNGRELSAFGEKLLREWLDDVGKNGLEEFTSACYMCMTAACLLNVVDFAAPDISAKARAILDKILLTMSLHTFHGSMIAPMGRIYGDVILPYTQGVQTLVHLIDPSSPVGNASEPWLSAFATTSYTFPAGAIEAMHTPIETSYTSGSALIRLEKTRSHILTSVQSPRTDPGYRHWENTTLTEHPDKGCHQWTKSLNERFHGTTDFNPGYYGYQQHMWTLGLGPDTVIFANHPGGTFQESSMRPGYWYGNGIMPAVRQEKGILGAIYEIPESHPIPFTHLYVPTDKCDEVLFSEDRRTLTVRKAGACVWIWSANPLERFDNDALSGCELRVHNPKNAYLLCVEDTSDFAAFRAKYTARPVVFENDTLFVGGTPFLVFRARKDQTQYL